jgi:hypothetical protein
VLIANCSDKTLWRNYYTYHLYRKMGRWAPRMEFCELVVDGEYQGIYLLGERIKRGANRVPISSISLADTLGEDLTGGYIFKMDWEDPGDIGWNSDFQPLNAAWPMRYLFHYPKPENIHPAHIDYLKSYVDSFEYAMSDPNFADPDTGYRQFIDEESFIDYIILTEFTKNVDGYRLSTFLHKDKNGEIVAGPPWDYDLSWGNADYMDAWLASGWDYQVQGNFTNQCAFWWQRFFQDLSFQNDLKCRWLELREDILHPQTVKAELDSLAGVLSLSTDLNFTKWPILGVYVWPNPAPIPQTYPGEIEKLKSWVDMRIGWLDTHWTGECMPSATQTEPLASSFRISIFPNPNDGSFQVFADGAESGEIEIADLAGRIVYRGLAAGNPVSLQLALSPGVYFLSYRTVSGIRVQRLAIGAQ